jgi:ubiquinone/menaquinone biosynthesis C-methylase UbiE
MLKAGWRVLDLCCGRGLLLPFIKRYCKDIAEYVGLDICEKNVREAQRRACGKEIDHTAFYPFPHRWVISDAVRMSEHLPADYFDFVAYLSSLEHMHKDAGEQSLHECTKVMKAGAMLALSCPRTAEDGDGYRCQYRAHLYEWRLSELRAALHKAGFSIEAEFGLLIGKRELRRVVESLGATAKLLLEPILRYLPSEFATACLAAPFPEASREVLLIARKVKRP